MKPFIFVLFLSLIYSCDSSSPAVKKSRVTIQGICLDSTETEAYGIRSKYGIEEIQVSPSGFEVEIDCKTPAIIEILIGRNTVYSLFIEPGENLTMVYQEKDILNRINSTEFRGSTTIENKVLSELNLHFKYHDSSEASFFNCAEDVFINRLEALKKVGVDILDKKRHEFPSLKNSFLVQAKNYIDYSIAYYLENYPQTSRTNFAKKRIPGK